MGQEARDWEVERKRVGCGEGDTVGGKERTGVDGIEGK